MRIRIYSGGNPEPQSNTQALKRKLSIRSIKKSKQHIHNSKHSSNPVKKSTQDTLSDIDFPDTWLASKTIQPDDDSPHSSLTTGGWMGPATGSPRIYCPGIAKV